MPELPEVEAARRLVERECVGKEITLAVAADDDKVIDGTSPRDLEAALVGRRVHAANRKGKQMWLDLGAGAPALLLHFGMTGACVVRGKGGAHYQRYRVEDAEWPPRFVKLELRFADGTSWAFCDSRRFARIKLQSDPLSQPPLSALGWDPLLSMPSLEEFTAAVSRQRRAVKALLLDQSFSAGVGNWVADEVLYQSQIHPEQPANSLSPQQLRSLHFHISDVCRVASDLGADAEKLPQGWLFHQRWSKGAKNKAKVDGHTIEHITVGGRTSAYVPALQKLNKAAAAAASRSGAGAGVAGKGRGAAARKRKEEAAAAEAAGEGVAGAAAPKRTKPGFASAGPIPVAASVEAPKDGATGKATPRRKAALALPAAAVPPAKPALRKALAAGAAATRVTRAAAG